MLPRYEFSFEATPELGPAALKCLLWKRGGVYGPIALILFPILLAVLAWDPRGRPAAQVLGGAALMLFVIFLAAARQRRSVRERFSRNAPSRVVGVVIEQAGVAVTTALGESRLPWTMIERLWQCETVALLFYQGWQYIALPIHAVPQG